MLTMNLASLPPTVSSTYDFPIGASILLGILGLVAVVCLVLGVRRDSGVFGGVACVILLLGSGIGLLVQDRGDKTSERDQIIAIVEKNWQLTDIDLESVNIGDNGNFEFMATVNDAGSDWCTAYNTGAGVRVICERYQPKRVSERESK